MLCPQPKGIDMEVTPRLQANFGIVGKTDMIGKKPCFAHLLMSRTKTKQLLGKQSGLWKIFEIQIFV